MSKVEALALARQAVREAQQWYEATCECVTYPGEMDEAMEAYCEAAEWFFELYDRETV